MISKKTNAEIEIMADGGKILAGIMNELGKNVHPAYTIERLFYSACCATIKLWGCHWLDNTYTDTGLAL